MILPLLKIGGQDQFRRYQDKFNDLYFPEKVTDVLGSRVVFEMRPSSCRHVCFKSGEEDGDARSKRNTWSQERAERIGWIGPALSDPSTEVRPHADNPARRVHLLIVQPEGTEAQEYFVVVTEQLNQGFALFITAFPADHRYWSKCRRAGKKLYSQPNKSEQEEHFAPPVQRD